MESLVRKGCLAILLIITTGQCQDTTHEPCQDNIDHCIDYDKSLICEGTYKPWATARCALYCGFCSSPDVTEPPCEDTIPNCDEYTHYACEHDSYRVWVETHCRKYCGRCGTNTTAATITGSPPATDSGNTVVSSHATVTKATADAIPTTAPAVVTLPTTATSVHAATITAAPSTETTKAATTTTAPPEASTTTPVQRTTPATSAASLDSCQDKLSFCATYSATACNDRAWGRQYCARRCNLCDEVVTGTATQHAAISNPAAAAATTAMPITAQTAATTTRPTTSSPSTSSPQPVTSSAALAAATATHPSGSCQDKLGFCNTYAKSACLDTQWATQFCQLYCDLC